MLTNLDREIISKFVNEYIDGLRMDVVILDSARVITEQLDSRIAVVDKVFFIDNSRKYEIFLRHPLENRFFIPKEIDFCLTKIVLDCDRNEVFEITNLYDAGVVESEAVKINDPKITDDCLRNLVSYMCFDVDYQTQNLEVKTAIDSLFLNASIQDAEILKRISPFLGIKSVY